MKRLIISILATVMLLTAMTVPAFAVGYTDDDGDGICDNRGSRLCFDDADGDGICDHRSQGKGFGLCRRDDNGTLFPCGRNRDNQCRMNCGDSFIDENEDGVCDNRQGDFADEDGDGVCDNRGRGNGQSHRHRRNQ